MVAVDIPGFGNLRLDHLVLDFNGTLAVDGQLLSGVGPLLGQLSESLTVHVLTADTFGRATQELAGLPLRLVVVGPSGQAEAKLDFVTKLDVDHVVAIGNGRNDAKMLGAVALGIAVLQREGGAGVALQNADVVSPSIVDALELLRYPLRLTATLRG